MLQLNSCCMVSLAAHVGGTRPHPLECASHADLCHICFLQPRVTGHCYIRLLKSWPSGLVQWMIIWNVSCALAANSFWWILRWKRRKSWTAGWSLEWTSTERSARFRWRAACFSWKTRWVPYHSTWTSFKWLLIITLWDSRYSGVRILLLSKSQRSQNSSRRPCRQMLMPGENLMDTSMDN